MARKVVENKWSRLSLCYLVVSVSRFEHVQDLLLVKTGIVSHGKNTKRGTEMKLITWMSN